MSRIRVIWNWLVEGRVVIMCLLVIYLAFHLGFVTWRTEMSVRIAGYGLQLVGMIFAIRGLLAIRKHFGQPLLRSLFVEWLKRFPLRNRVVNIQGNAVLGSINATGYVEAWLPDKPENEIEDRIADIVKNIERLKEGQRQNTRGLDGLKRDHERHKKAVAEKTKQIETSIKSDLETLHTSDIITTLVGLIWLTVGITFSTLAPELHSLL